MFGREKVAQITQEIGAFAKAIDHIKELQEAQQELKDSIRRLGDRVHALEVEFGALKAEIRVDTLRETQAAVNAVQGSFYQRLQDIAVEVALLRRETSFSSLPTERLGPRRDDGVDTET